MGEWVIIIHILQTLEPQTESEQFLRFREINLQTPGNDLSSENG